MERLSDKAIEIINELHTERLDYTSEYVPLINAANLLTEYECTGLTPEEINELLHDTTGPLHKKLGEWMKADSEGRLAVLPCKVRDKVWLNEWWIGQKWEKLYSPIERHVIYFSVEPDGIYAHLKEGCINVKYFDQVVFQTREEAEAALWKEEAT